MSEYNALAARLQDAFEAYRDVYQVQSPPPAMPQVESNNRLTRLALMGILSGSIVVSGSHTIPTFTNGRQDVLSLLVGISAFIMVELAVIAYAYIRTQHHYRTHRSEPDNMATLIKAGLFSTLFVAIASNLHYTLKGADFDQGTVWQAFDFIISISIGLSAPVLAFISGDILGMLGIVDQARERRAWAEYDNARKLYDEALLRSWNSNKAKWGASVSVQSVSIGQLDTGQEKNSPSGHKFNRTSNATDTVKAHLEQYPEDIALPVRELAEKIGVGKSTVSNVLKQMKEV